MSGLLIMKYIFFAFIIYFVYLVVSLLIKTYRKSQANKTQPVYFGGRTSPIQLNKKHPSYQKNLSEINKKTSDRKSSISSDYDSLDDVYDTIRRSSTTSSSYVHHDTSSHHSDSSSSSSDSGGGDGGGD